MQSTASKRVLSTLASKLHPQLPLSPRESQQLLTLLTTSFRTHLDREFPKAKQANLISKNKLLPGPSPARSISSFESTSQHINSILTDPLFAVKPQRRGSQPAAIDVLRDPQAWFVDQIAAGTATLSKAVMCIELLRSTPYTPARQEQEKSLANTTAQWLRTSGTDSSREFVLLVSTSNYQPRGFLYGLLDILMAEGQTSVPWRWYIKTQAQRIKETNLEESRVAQFRRLLLSTMVRVNRNRDVNAAVAVFLQAFRMAQIEGHEVAFSILRPAGAALVNYIIATPNHSIQPEAYQSFIGTLPLWLGDWSSAVEAMLWLHHPQKRSALQGLRYIQDHQGAVLYAQSTRSRKGFLVQLCLGVARQLLEEEKYTDAQIAMEFTKVHFADLVLPKTKEPTSRSSKERREKQNLEMLDRLIPT